MKRQDGFTIIEVTLFLAVSGFFAISLLVGASTAVQRQSTAILCSILLIICVPSIRKLLM